MMFLLKYSSDKFLMQRIDVSELDFRIWLGKPQFNTLLFLMPNLTCFWHEMLAVFKYDPPVGNNSHPHNVYLLPNFKSFMKCDLSKAKEIANTTQGAGEGFAFVLEKRQPYYFACGVSNGVHCDVGHMKFSVMPTLRARFGWWSLAWSWPTTTNKDRSLISWFSLSLW